MPAEIRHAMHCVGYVAQNWLFSSKPESKCKRLWNAALSRDNVTLKHRPCTTYGDIFKVDAKFYLFISYRLAMLWQQVYLLSVAMVWLPITAKDSIHSRQDSVSTAIGDWFKTSEYDHVKRLDSLLSLATIITAPYHALRPLSPPHDPFHPSPP